MNISDAKNLLTAEDLTRTTVTTLSFEDFSRIADIANSLDCAEDKAQFRDYCTQLLTANKNSIAAKILATLTGEHPKDDRFLLEVVESAVENNRTDIAESGAKLVLNYSENDYALSVLASVFEDRGETAHKVQIWERLVKVNYEDIEVLMKLAQHYIAENDLNLAMNCYANAAERILRKQDFVGIGEIWNKIADLKKDNPEYLIGKAEHFAQALSEGRGIFVLEDLLCREICDEEQTIYILKKLIKMTGNSPAHIQYLNRLIEIYKTKYASNPRLSVCFKNTSLLHPFGDVCKIIDNFETQIQFTEGAFVFHNSWGVGRILKIESPSMELVFPKTGKKTMTESLAYTSLKVLPKNNIRVLKAAVSKEKLNQKFLSDTAWGLKTLIESYGGACSFKDMKNELFPAILNQSEWTQWSKNAKNELMTNPGFCFKDNDIETYVIRKAPCTYEEKIYARFLGESDFFNKIRTLREFISSKGSIEDVFFKKMVAYFSAKANMVKENTEALCSWLLLHDLERKLSIDTGLTAGFAEYFNLVKLNLYYDFEKIEDSDLKRIFIDELIALEQRDWAKNLKTLFPLYLNQMIPEKLKAKKQYKIYNAIISESISNAKSTPEVFMYLIKTLDAKEWAKADADEPKLLYTMIDLLNHCGMSIANKNDVTRYKRISDSIIAYLFTADQKLKKFLASESDREVSKQLYSLLKNSSAIDAHYKNMMREYVSRNCAEAAYILNEKQTVEVIADVIPTSLLCMQKTLDAKIAEMKDLLEVQIPENAREIADARALGDLRENAEYQYAKDRKRNLEFMKGKLTKEISAARVVKNEEVDASKFSYGTVATLKNNLTGETVTYTILGPWESDPDKNILNFKAPLCIGLYNKKAGERVKFEINETKFDFTIEKIEKAEF